MKILFLLSRIEKSGVTLHTLDLAEGLIANGHELIMITGGITDPDNPYLLRLYQRFKDLGVQIHLFKTPKGSILKKAGISIASIWKISRLIRAVKPDIIHSQSPYMTFIPWLLRKNFVTTVHNVQLVKNLKYKNPTLMIAISQESKTYAIEVLGAKSDSVEVVCHGVSERYAQKSEAHHIEELRKKYDIKKDEIVIGYVGRITREKGLDILVDAIVDHLAPELISRIHLIFLGDYFHSRDKKWFFRLKEKAGKNLKLSLIPFQDPKSFYDIFTIFVLPSMSEAFGLVCVEAMMSGCCTIRTDTNGAIDQIDHGVDGFIFPNQDTQALAAILEQMILTPEHRNQIAEMGRKKALENFTVSTMARNTIKVYEKLV